MHSETDMHNTGMGSLNLEVLQPCVRDNLPLNEPKLVVQVPLPNLQAIVYPGILSIPPSCFHCAGLPHKGSPGIPTSPLPIGALTYNP